MITNAKLKLIKRYGLLSIDYKKDVKKRKITLKVMGWSVRNACVQSYVFTSSCMAPWSPDPSIISTLPDIGNDGASALGLLVAPRCLRTCDPPGDLLKIIRWQKETMLEHVGGAAILTEIDADSIRQSVVHRWNDQVGDTWLSPDD